MFSGIRLAIVALITLGLGLATEAPAQAALSQQVEQTSAAALNKAKPHAKKGKHHKKNGKHQKKQAKRHGKKGKGKSKA